MSKNVGRKLIPLRVTGRISFQTIQRLERAGFFVIMGVTKVLPTSK